MIVECRDAGRGMKGREMKMAKFAFSLIDLLVVIAVIGILIGLLLPAFSKAERNARDVVCGDNLKHLTYGFLMYADGDRYHNLPANEHIENADLNWLN